MIVQPAATAAAEPEYLSILRLIGVRIMITMKMSKASNGVPAEGKYRLCAACCSSKLTNKMKTPFGDNCEVFEAFHSFEILEFFIKT